MKAKKSTQLPGQKLHLHFLFFNLPNYFSVIRLSRVVILLLMEKALEDMYVRVGQNQVIVTNFWKGNSFRRASSGREVPQRTDMSSGHIAPVYQ